MSPSDEHCEIATIPYGAWPSPLDAKAIAAGAGGFAELRACAGTLYWLETRPQENGRATLMCAAPGAPVRELTPAPGNVRSRVHEYGGGAYLPTVAGVFLVDDHDGEIHHKAPDGTSTRLTDCRGTVRFADFCWDATRRQLIAVCERPGPAGGEPENLLVVLPFGVAPIPPDGLLPLHRGHDFYAAPRLAPDAQRLAFIAWDHPNMPWDGTLLKLAELDRAGMIVSETVVAGSAVEAVQQPLWMSDGALVFVSDQNGFWNLYRYDDSGVYVLLEDGAEYAEAPWVLAGSTVAALGPAHLVAARFSAGCGELVLIDARSGFASPLATDWQEHESLCAIAGAVAFIGRRADGPPVIATLQMRDGASTRVATAWLPDLDPAAIARAEPREFRARDGERIHGLLYRPTLPGCRAPQGTRPPLLVMVHGGPTARTSAALNLRVQYLTTRGWAVLEVDYRGSTGHGRRYRDALNGHWGLLDVADCEDAARALLQEGLVDPDRIAIRGSSAGGFTVLAALAASNLFRAGASLYGIGDLAALARETHKFESRYLETLVGHADAYAARSPIKHALRIRSPVLFLQGSEDRVVPPAQATAMADALRARGIAVAHVEFAGEGHGFRRAANIERALESEYAFFCRVFGIEPAAALPPMEIDNL